MRPTILLLFSCFATAAVVAIPQSPAIRGVGMDTAGPGDGLEISF